MLDRNNSWLKKTKLNPKYFKFVELSRTEITAPNNLLKDTRFGTPVYPDHYRKSWWSDWHFSLFFPPSPP